jgi:hypothetical protein
LKTKLIIIVGLVGLAVAGFFLRIHPAEASVWRELSQRVPTQALTTNESQFIDDAIFARLTPEQDQVGHLRLENGDIWRFAFRSHHRLGGLDSFSVFAGPPGTFRVRGDYFCCDVQFPGQSLPKDSAGFLAFLRRVNSSVEPVQ